MKLNIRTLVTNGYKYSVDRVSEIEMITWILQALVAMSLNKTKIDMPYSVLSIFTLDLYNMHTIINGRTSSYGL